MRECLDSGIKRVGTHPGPAREACHKQPPSMAASTASR